MGAALMLRQRPNGLRNLVDSDRFNLAVSGVIVANAVTLGMGTFPSFANSALLSTLNTAFYTAFCVEVAVRLVAYGKSFFRHGWNVFDLLVVMAALIPGVGASAQALRLVRLGRIVRLVRFLPDARMLIASVARALPSLGSLVVLTLLLIFVYGMLGWTLFGQQLTHSWGTLGSATLTLFVLLTLENFPVYLEEAMAVSPWAVPYFVSYALLAAFIIFNLLIGVIITSMEDARESARPKAGAEGQIAVLRKALDELEAAMEAGK